VANKVVHFEVTGRDGKRLQKFYGDLFGWEFNTDNPGGYGLVAPAEGAIGGGVGTTSDGSQGMATFYVESDDIARHLKEAEAAGGKTVFPETEVGGATIGLFADPEGHVVGLVKTQP
jgi:predicted enzyme related to lactoylglutathione lyase